MDQGEPPQKGDPKSIETMSMLQATSNQDSPARETMWGSDTGNTDSANSPAFTFSSRFSSRHCVRRCPPPLALSSESHSPSPMFHHITLYFRLLLTESAHYHLEVIPRVLGLPVALAHPLSLPERTVALNRPIHYCTCIDLILQPCYTCAL